jgi:protein-S-isoprenylcysteine O-methyltransferase Ste14
MSATRQIAGGALVVASAAMTTVPRLLRRMTEELGGRGALTGSTTGWMYAGYAAHATLYVGALTAGGRPSSRTSRALGSSLMVAGGLLCIRGMSRFTGPGHVSGTAAGPFVTDGVYGLTRNPQYLGYVALLDGGALARRSVPALVLSCVAAAVLDCWVPVEERHLSRTHGPAYDDYAAHTPRWLGRPRRSSSASVERRRTGRVGSRT